METQLLLAQLQAILYQEADLIASEINTAKKLRDQAPSAMESHSDTTRSEQEKMILALQNKTSQIKLNLTLLHRLINTPNIMLKTIPYKIKNEDVFLVIVPDGLGGRRFKNYLFISQSAPLAKQYTS